MYKTIPDAITPLRWFELNGLDRFHISPYTSRAYICIYTQLCKHIALYMKGSVSVLVQGRLGLGGWCIATHKAQMQANRPEHVYAYSTMLQILARTCQT